MKKAILIVCLMIIGVFSATGLRGQGYAVVAQPLCWSISGQDSSITRYVLVSTRSNTVVSITYANAAGNTVNVSAGGTFAQGHCGCCSGGGGGGLDSIFAALTPNLLGIEVIHAATTDSVGLNIFDLDPQLFPDRASSYLVFWDSVNNVNRRLPLSKLGDDDWRWVITTDSSYSQPLYRVGKTSIFTTDTTYGFRVDSTFQFSMDGLQDILRWEDGTGQFTYKGLSYQAPGSFAGVNTPNGSNNLTIARKDDSIPVDRDRLGTVSFAGVNPDDTTRYKPAAMIESYADGNWSSKVNGTSLDIWVTSPTEDFMRNTATFQGDGRFELDRYTTFSDGVPESILGYNGTSKDVTKHTIEGTAGPNKILGINTSGTNLVWRDTSEFLTPIYDSLAVKPTGSGTTNRVPLWTGTRTLGNSYLAQVLGTTLSLDANKSFRQQGGTTGSRTAGSEGEEWFNTTQSEKQLYAGGAWKDVLMGNITAQRIPFGATSTGQLTESDSLVFSSSRYLGVGLSNPSGRGHFFSIPDINFKVQSNSGLVEYQAISPGSSKSAGYFCYYGSTLKGGVFVERTGSQYFAGGANDMVLYSVAGNVYVGSAVANSCLLTVLNGGSIRASRNVATGALNFSEFQISNSAYSATDSTQYAQLGFYLGDGTAYPGGAIVSRKLRNYFDVARGDSYLEIGPAVDRANTVVVRIQEGKSYFGSSVAPTAIIDVGGSTTARSSLRIRSGTAPSTFFGGEIWRDTTQKTLSARINNLTQNLQGVIFTGTSSVTVSNTTTETSIAPSGTGTLTLPANFFVAGKTVEIEMWGIHATDAVVKPSLELSLYLGSSKIATTGSQTLNLSSAGQWHATILITCRTTGATGTIFTQGETRYGTNGVSTEIYVMRNSTTNTVDTTTSLAISPRAQWAAADPDDTITINLMTVKVLN